MNRLNCISAFLCVGLVASTSGASAARADVVISVDAAANLRAIDPRIYGVAYATPEQLRLLGAPLHRMGGNNTSRYNWKQNADNRAADWFFQSIAEEKAAPGARGDDFIRLSREGRAEPMLTLPLIDWVAKVGPNRERLFSFSVAKYGPQQKTDQWAPDAGNGVKPDGSNLEGNDPNDANTPNTPAMQAEWMQHIVGKWGASKNGGLKYVILDNEPALWHSTHRDVHPKGVRLADLAQKIIATSRAVKAVDPDVLVVAPEEWGWTGFVYSGHDSQMGATVKWDTAKMPDRVAHGNQDAFPALLGLLKASDERDNARTLDVVTLHFYPQGGEFGGNVSAAMQDRRNRSTRSLWDANYTDETWINAKVRLIPRLREWADGYRKGIPIGVTEYNWGAEDHINGATTQADILGIFGREGLDIAARWTTPATATPTFKAMQIFRNPAGAVDGANTAFGDVSVACNAPNPDKVSAFAAMRSTDKALTIVLINKQRETAEVAIVDLKNYTPRADGTAAAWQLTSKNVIEKVAAPLVQNGQVKMSLPAQSVTLVVLK
jgi:hypothetical protein